MKSKIGFRIFQISGYALFFTVVMLFAYLTETEIQVTLGLISFFATRYTYNKTYHSNSVLKCLSISILIFIVYSLFSFSLHLTILVNVLIGAVITFGLYLIKDYKDSKESIKDLNEMLTVKKNSKIYKGMKLDEIHQIIDCIDLTNLEIKILEDFYCKRINLTELSNSIGFTYQYTHEIKARILDKISKYYK